MAASAASEQMRERIAAMSTGMAARAPEAEKLRHLPEENVQGLAEAGLFRVFQPQRFGGTELHMAEVLPLIIETARSCPSTAWVMAVLQIHPWLLGSSPEQAQEDVWGTDPTTRLGGVLQPKGMASRVEGGYQLGEATWPYSSGCDFASWSHLGGLIKQNSGPPEPAVFLLPREDYEIIDDWHVVGLRATGSKSLRVSGAFVPEHRVFRLMDAVSGALSKGHSPVYRSSMMPMLCLNVTGPALGAAQRALEIFLGHIENRNLPFSMEKQVDSPQTQQLVGHVQVLIESADLLLDKGCALVRDYAEADRDMPLDERSRVRAYSSAAVRHCVDAIDQMFLASGGTALQEDHPLQRLLRDARGMAAHAALNHENNLALWGAVRLDKPLNSPMV